MNDIILNSFLMDFSKRFDYENVSESLQFEYFVTHCLVAQDYQGHFDPEDLSVGDANGIDSIAIFVNDILIESSKEIEGLSRQNIEVKFLFIQSKTSPSYDQGSFLKFTQAVRYFFSKDAKPNTYHLQEWHDIKDSIYKKAIKFAENPTISLRYATASPLRPSELILGTAGSEKRVLEESGLFSVVDIDFINAEDLKSIYRTLSNKITKQIVFEKHTILPKIQGVKRAFIGILPCKEYLRLICDEDGNLLRNVFYDNVRDYQGNNSVNREILSTITSDKDARETFVLLNNGVTVVCRSINPVGSDFTVRDFQVVNGCQTSHVLHKNSELLSGNEFLTIKLIETEDVELTNKITKATNRQTEVKLEAFAGLQPFHKELETFYSSIALSERLYYERRPGQFDFDSTIKHNKVVSIPSQIQSFLSVFLEEPHKVHFYYGQLLEDYSSGNESALFNETHDPYPYYMASRLTFLVIEKLKRKSRQQLKWKYHLAAMIRIIIGGPFNLNRLSDSSYCKRYCDNIKLRLIDFDTYFEKALGVLNKLSGQARSPKDVRDLQQSEKLANSLIEYCKGEFIKNNNLNGRDVRDDNDLFDGNFIGSVKQIAQEKKFGIIRYGQREFYFKFKAGDYAINSRVRFKVRRAGDTTEAFDVTVI